MKAWVEVDDRGREYLERAGTGHVSAVVAVGVAGPDGGHTFSRVEIQCDPPRGRSGAIRYSAHPIVADEVLRDVATASQRDGFRVAWVIQWHRHDWIPSGLPVTALNLGTDARCILASLAPVLVSALDYAEDAR